MTGLLPCEGQLLKQKIAIKVLMISVLVAFGVGAAVGAGCEFLRNKAEVEAQALMPKDSWVNVAYCALDIPVGKRIELKDLEFRQIRYSRCPCDPVTSVWEGFGRSIVHAKKKGDFLYPNDFGFHHNKLGN